MMLAGGVSGMIGAFFYERCAGDAYIGWLAVLITTLSALLGAAVMALIYSFLTVTLRANQNVTGLALTTFGMGVGNFFGGSLAQLFGEGGSLSVKRTSEVFCKTLPFADDLGAVGTLLFDYGFLVYLSVAIALVVAWFLKKTRAGLNLRSVGEDPATADASQVPFNRHRWSDRGLGWPVLHYGLYPRHVERRRLRRPRLAGYRVGDFCLVETCFCYLGFVPVRRSVCTARLFEFR